MGAWGTGIYQNDVAEDIKHDYINKQKAGKSEETALKEVLYENKVIFEDEDDKYGAWCALADTMWKYGRLTEEIKRKALEVIEEEKNCIEERWNSRKDIAKRMQVLSNLKEQLISEQPSKKRISVHKPFIPKWKKGDVYQYEITDIPENYPSGKEYKGWFVLIYVWDFVEYEFTVRGVKDLLSVIYMKLSKHRISSPLEFNSVTAWCNNGGLKYRYELLESSNRFLKNMEYVGECSNFIYPEDEIVADERDYGLASMSMFGVDAVKGYLCEKHERERYRLVEYATGLSPQEQIIYYKNLGDIDVKMRYEQVRHRKNEIQGISVSGEERTGCGYICPWKPGKVYRYKIEDAPNGMERYIGWYILIYVYQMRGLRLEEQGKIDIVPDIFVQVVDEKISIGNFSHYKDMELLEYHMPFVCFAWDGKSSHGSYKAVITEMDKDKFMMEKMEDTKETCWWYFPDGECGDAVPERINQYNLVEKSLEGYERELQRLGIDKGLDTIDVIKRYIEVMGGSTGNCWIR